MTLKDTIRICALQRTCALVVVIGVLFPLLAGAQNASVSLRRKASKPQATDANLPFFLAPVSYDTGASRTRSMVVADLNKDGNADVIVGSFDTVGVLLGKGNGAFQPLVTYEAGGVFSPLALGDVNRDGKLDLIVGNADGISVLLGNGDGSFQSPVNYDLGYISTSVAVADLNHDGKPDIVVANCALARENECDSEERGNVSVFIGHGDGSFEPPVTYDSGGYQANSVVIADVNGDGKPDLIIANQCAENCTFDGEGSVTVLLGKGDGTFQPAVPYDPGASDASDVVAADVNGDGKVDLLVANCLASNVLVCGTSNGRVSVLLGNGDGTFQTATTYDSGGIFADSIAVADVNADGNRDLIVSNYGAGVIVMLGNGDGTFQAAQDYASGGVYPYSVAVADLNGDGKPDALVANGCADNSCKGNGSVGILLHVGSTHSATTLTSSQNPWVFGQGTFYATVTSGSGTPTGTVEFFDSVNLLGSGDLINGAASISGATAGAGTDAITAVYQGSVKYQPSASTVLNQVVNIATTTTSLKASLNPIPVKQVVTYTAAITSQYGGVATGWVTFRDGNSTVATVWPSNNTASFRTSYSGFGDHSITAIYEGDANNSGSQSPTITEYVRYPSVTKLSTSGSPSMVGQFVTFTAAVTSKNGAIPDGEIVTFTDLKTPIGSAPLSGGSAVFSTSSLAPKTHTIVATYPGDSSFKESSGSVKQVVEEYSTSTALSSSLNPSTYGEAVTFTAKVTGTGPTPGGKLQFKDGTKILATVALNNAAAALTTSKLASGTHTITADYLGDGVSAKSTSPVVNQVVH